MPDYQWPDPEHRTLIGQRVSRVDSPDKVSGQARYTYDVNRPGLLFGKMLRSPYAHCKIVSIDTSAAEKMPGVKAIEIVQKPGANIHWAGDEVVAVAAIDESTAEDAVRAIQVKYQKLPHLVTDNEPPQGAGESQGPLSMDDLGDMLDNQVPERQIISLIEQYGVSFKATEQDYKDAKEEGVPDTETAKLVWTIGIIGCFVLLLACINFINLTTAQAAQRAKEIGVRKVLGASVPGILRLLAGDFLKLVILAIVIATPVAWYVMNKWLQDFAYKVSLGWTVFVVAGAAAIGIALLTISFQSIRAALVNPVKALRTE